MVSDGAWGTFLQKKGLALGECPELWNVTHRKEVLEIAQSYIDAGSQLIETNSFGGNIFKLEKYGLKERSFELNKAAAEISREAAGDTAYVLGSIGPSGKFLMMGEVTDEELYHAFKIQAMALEEGGADAICIETFFAQDEAECAIKAAKENTNLEIICTFTFDKQPDESYKTMMGVSPSAMADFLLKSGADIIGTNCGNGFNGMEYIVKEIRAAQADVPILVHANAGIPVLKNGETIYTETPDIIAHEIPKLINAGANAIGGCCGTTPAHIKKIVEVVSKCN